MTQEAKIKEQHEEQHLEKLIIKKLQEITVAACKLKELQSLNLLLRIIRNNSNYLFIDKPVY